MDPLSDVWASPLSTVDVYLFGSGGLRENPPPRPSKNPSEIGLGSFYLSLGVHPSLERRTTLSQSLDRYWILLVTLSLRERLRRGRTFSECPFPTPSSPVLPFHYPKTLPARLTGDRRTPVTPLGDPGSTRSVYHTVGWAHAGEVRLPSCRGSRVQPLPPARRPSASSRVLPSSVLDPRPVQDGPTTFGSLIRLLSAV